MVGSEQFRLNAPRQSRKRTIGPAFTLIEALIATVLVGLGIAAMMVSTQSGTRVAAHSQELTQAIYIASEIREWTLKLPFKDPQTPTDPPGPDADEDPQIMVDDLDDLMSVTFSPPRDAMGRTIDDMSDWSETITLTWRDKDNLTSIVNPGESEMVFVQVVVSHNGKKVLSTGWLIAGSE